MRELAARDVQTVGGNDAYRQRLLAENLPRYALIAGPDAEFLKGIDYAVDIINAVYGEHGGSDAFYAAEEVRAYIGELFTKRAVPYRYEEYEIAWAGDRGATTLSSSPRFKHSATRAWPELATNSRQPSDICAPGLRRSARTRSRRPPNPSRAR